MVERQALTSTQTYTLTIHASSVLTVRQAINMIRAAFSQKIRQETE